MGLLEAALEFVAQGQPVFPCRVLDKRPATAAGFKDATLDPDLIETWWEKAEYNIGLPTGILFDVIDLDGIDGIEAFEEFCQINGVDYEPTVLTPSGGCHIYVKPTGQGNRAGMLTHVDYRGIGGYVLGAPSQLEHGTYRWT